MIVRAMAVALMSATPLPVLSQEAAYGAVQLTDEDVKVDGGTRPNARATAEITAPDGMFIWVPSIVVSHAGSRGMKSATQTRYPSDRVHSDLAALAAQSVTYVVVSRAYNPFGTSSVTAASHVAALAYPVEVFATLVTQRLGAEASQ